MSQLANGYNISEELNSEMSDAEIPKQTVPAGSRLARHGLISLGC